MDETDAVWLAKLAAMDQALLDQLAVGHTIKVAAALSLLQHREIVSCNLVN